MSRPSQATHKSPPPHLSPVGTPRRSAGEQQGAAVKNGWQTKPLGDLCDVLDYKRKPITKRDRIAGDYPYYGATGVLGHVEGYLFDEPLVLVGEDGAKWESGENTAFAVEGRIWVNNHAHVLRPHRTELLDNWLIYHLNYSDLTEFVSGLTVPKLNQGSMREIPVPLPPLPEQQRIVGLLDEAFAGLATAEANAAKNLQNARALFESHLQSVFTQRGEGWQQKTLEEIATTFGRGKSKHRPRNEPKLYGGEYPFIQTGDIRNANHFITEYSQTYSEAGLAQSKLWPKGTICITIAANIAETGILGFDACFPDSIIGVVPNPKEAEVGFIEYLLRSFKARLQAMGKGSAQANINMGTFEHERFPFPPVTEQKQIAAKLDSLREETQRLATLYERKLTALEALKKSLLHQAFTGQL
jgi:type I restriction enzyme, S subunit